jgi:putative oxidoreductase
VEAADFGLLLLRVTVGLTIMAHGYNKLFGGGRLPGTARWFESMGLRNGWLQARLSCATELGAGLLFALGLLTPLAAAGVIGLMTVTILVDHRFNGFFVFRKGEGVEYVTVLAVAAASIAATGPGTASLDHAFGWDERNGWTSLVIAAVVGVGAAVLVVALFWRNPRKAASAP